MKHANDNPLVFMDFEREQRFFDETRLRDKCDIAELLIEFEESQRTKIGERNRWENIQGFAERIQEVFDEDN